MPKAEFLFTLPEWEAPPKSRGQFG